MRRSLDGDKVIAEWSADDPASLDAARAALAEGLEDGYHAVRGDADGAGPLSELPVDADVVILTMPMGGG